MLLLGMASVAWAKSWCAAPLVAHEWGVHVIRTDGGEAKGVPTPAWFHLDDAPLRTAAAPVRDLPPDSGIRDLPVMQFYSPSAPAPVAIEVGFGSDAASAWFPQVDRRLSAAQASSADARAGRERLVAARAARTTYGTNPALGPDPTKQLGWDALNLAVETPSNLRSADQAWVSALRKIPSALWVDTGLEADRFLFYEAHTHDAPDLVLEHGDSWSSTRPHYLVRNVSPYVVHDVVVIADGKAWSAPAVPAGATAGFLLDEPLDRDALVAWLRSRWVDPAGPPTEFHWTADDCVMMRDPAVPVESSAGYRLYGPELDVLLNVWADRMLVPAGVRMIYREDPAALDARMPVAVYTDMRHYVELDRLGVVVVEGAKP